MSEEKRKLEQITFIDDETGEEHSLFVLEQTTLNESKYLLVCEDDSDETDAYIFKEVSESDTEITYVPIEDDNEYEALIKVFTELLEDAEIKSGS